MQDVGQERVEERQRQKVQLELAVGAASALPQRPHASLTFPPFHELLRR